MATERNKLRERAYTVFFMFAVTFVAISVVAGIHLATASTVSRNEKLYLQRAVAEAAGKPAFESVDALVEWFNESVQPLPPEDDPRAYAIENGDGAAGYVFVRIGKGLWGDIRAVVGMGPELEAFKGVTFVKHNETPGLGARISEAWFKQQFEGKTGPFELVPEGTQSDSPTEMDAITGATITSKAVRDMLNELQRTAPSAVTVENGQDGTT